jgi:16S rRNA (uracil1498-N3)-methyltransferase
MAEHRFYVDKPLPQERGGEISLTGDSAHRISSVLRMRPGDRLALFDGSHEFECELLETRPRVRARVIEPIEAAPLPRRLTLFQALIRPNRFEWLIEKVTELGVAAIVPVVTEHASVRPQSIGSSRIERWRRIAIEASEQSGRGCPPELREPIDFAQALQVAPAPALFAWEGMRSQPASRVQTPEGELALFVGPEGGWSEGEVASAREAGLSFVSLSRNILRSETAAIVATALLLTD